MTLDTCRYIYIYTSIHKFTVQVLYPFEFYSTSCYLKYKFVQLMNACLYTNSTECTEIKIM